jgi:inner membrane protein
MENLSFVPAGDLVTIDLQSSWAHPEFVGVFLPSNRDVNSEGFSAHWSVTQFASGIEDKLQRCEHSNCDPLKSSRMGVRLIDPVDVYLQSERSVKYGILFVGLSFISFFLFENLKKIRIHPIQYALVGLSVATFYLLLISLSEHISFGVSYLIATIACVSLIFAYLKSVLAGLSNSLWFSAALAALYGILYIIIQAEDFALLMGAILVFGMLSIVMLITRRIDWYEIGENMNLQRKLDFSDKDNQRETLA